MRFRTIFTFTALVVVAATASTAASDNSRLFPNSQLVTSDRISVEVVGKGPDIVLIPGLASSSAVWKHTAERLRDHYRLHIVQVAGFAGAAPRANASGPVVAPTVAAIASYITTAKLSRPAIIGHSLGGLMALELAAEHPGSIGKVLVVDALPFYTEIFAGPSATAAAAQPIATGMGSKMLAASDAEFAASAAQTASFMATAKEDQARIAAWSVRSTRQTMVTAMQEDMTTDFRPRVQSIEAPVTVIYEAPLNGLVEKDYAPLKHGTLIAEPAGVKHFVMYDDPAGFDKAVDQFLAK